MGLLNDRYKRLKGGEEEKKEEGVLNQRAQGIYTSREAAKYDEEERREYEGDGSIRTHSERATSAYDLALKMLQDDEDYFNSLEGRAGIGANEHSWKSTMQSIYANKMLKDSKGTIDSKLGAGATDALRTAVNGTAIGAQRNAHIVNQKSKLYKEFGGYDNYQQALANAPTPEAATKRKESYQSDLNEIERLNTAISEREKAGPTNYKTVSYPAWGGEGMIDVREPDNSDLDEMKKQRDRLLKKTRSYEQKQKKQDEALIGTPTGEMAYLRPDLFEIDENDPLERYLRVSGRNVGTPSAKQEKALNKLLGTEEYNEAQRPQTLSAEPDFDALSGISPTENAKRTQESETPWADKDTTAYDTRPAGEPNPLVFTDSKGQFADKLAEEKGNDNAWSELTDEEIRYYRSLKNTSGDAAAETWLAGMKAVLNKRRVDRENQAYQEFKNNMPWYGRIPFDLVETAATVIAKPFGDMAAFADYVTDWITGDDDPNDILNAGQIMVSRSRARTASDLNKIFNVNVGAFDFGLGDVYQAFVSGADSLWGRTLSSAANLPGDTYTYVMAAGAAAEKRREMWGEGADDWQVFTSSLAAGLIEWATEKISYDVFAKNFLERKPGSPWEWIAKSGLSGTIEGTEEFHGNVLNRAVNDAVMGANSDTQLAIDKYMSEGKTHDEAVMLVLGDDVAADIKDFLAGFLSMGPNIGSTVSGAISEHNQAVQTGSDIISINAQDILRATAQDMVSAGSETEVEKSAAKRNVKQALNRFENKPTAANTGYLANTVENAIDQGYGNPETAIKAGMNVMRSLEPTTDIRTAETSDGQTVTINEDNPIARFEDGKAILNTSNGEMSVDDLSFADDSARLAYDNVNTYDVETANAVLNNYQSGDIARYLAGMREGIELHGKMDVPSEAVSYYSTLSEENQRYAKTLGQTMRQTIVNKAVQAAKTGTIEQFEARDGETLAKTFSRKGAFGTNGATYTYGTVDFSTKEAKQARATANRVADITGNAIITYDSRNLQNDETKLGRELKNADGKYVYRNGAIYVDIAAGPQKAQGLVAYALAHELTHSMEQWAREEYDAYADWLIKNYSESGASMEDLVKEKMAREGKDYEDAYHEVVADASSRMLIDTDVLEKLESLREKDPNVFKRVVAQIRKFVKSLSKIYDERFKGVQPTESALTENFSDEGLKKLRELWVEGAVKTAERRSAAVERSQEASQAVVDMGINIDKETESANPDAFSLKTWEESDYVQNLEVAAKELAEELGVSLKDARKYIRDVNSIAKIIAADRTRLDFDAAPGLSAFISNVEYGGSIDFSTICKKRRLMTGTMGAIQEAIGNTPLSITDFLNIRNMMKAKGYEVSCGLCYVEGSRAQMGKFAAQFRELYQKYNPDAEWIPTQSDLVTPDKVEKMRTEHPDVYEEYEHFWNNHGKLREGDPNLFASQQKPKLFQADTEYNGEILNSFRDKNGKVDKEAVKAKNRNGGLRIQSFSDFEIIHLLDCMQVITDMSRVGLAGQAYTKVADFARALGPTGLKINLSLIAKGVDENGNIILDEVEGMKKSDAEDLRNKYSDNVGTILVVFSDAQLKAALNDPFIDFIIPFHRSQWARKYYDAMGLPGKVKDFTSKQNEKLLRKTYHEFRGRLVADKARNFMPNEYWEFDKGGKYNAEKYLRMCAEQNKKPKFDNLLVNNGDGSYSLQPDGSTDGYWKLLIDFKMYNNEGKGAKQMPVKPQFDIKESNRMLDEYEGGHQTYPVAQDIVDEFLKSRNSDKSKSYVSPSDSARYLELAKDPKANEAELSRMVEAAAEQSMPDTVVRDRNGNLLTMYHGTSRAGFTIFDYGHRRFGLFGTGYYFTDNKDVAEGYTRKGRGTTPGIYEVYLNITNPLDMDAKADIDKWKTALDEADLISTELQAGMTNEDAFRVLKDVCADEMMTQFEAEETIEDILTGMGYDGLTHRGGGRVDPNGARHRVYIAFNSEQIKSADPVTYDDNGNVIPLEERFNPENEDIRFSDKNKGYTTAEEAKESQKGKEYVSDRELLASALQNAARDSVEYEYLEKYKENAEKLDGMQARLDDINGEIRSMTFGKEKGKPLTEGEKMKLRRLRDEATKLRNRITTIDKRLVKISAAEPIRNVLKNERMKSYREGRQKGKELIRAKNQRRELRNKIVSLVSNLSNRLVNPKVGKYVPMNLRKPVAGILSMIDTSTGRGEKLSAKLSALYMEYEAIKNDPKYAKYGTVYDPVTSEMIRRVTAAIEALEDVNEQYGRTGIYSREVEKGKSTGTVDTQLSVRLLDNLYEALKQFDTVIKDAVNIHGLGSALDETLTTQEVGEKLINEVRTENKNKSELRKRLLRGIHLTPDSFFSRLAGHKKDSMWSRVYKMIDNAQTKQLRIEMESNAIFREILKDQKYLRDITNTKKTYDVGLKDTNGKPVLLTKDMLLTLYKHLQNEDNTRHIIVGGMNLPNLNSYYKNRENSYNGEERMPGFVGEELAAKYKAIEEESEALEDAWEAAAVNNDQEKMARIEEKLKPMREEADAIVRKGEKQARELLKNIEDQLDDKDRKFIEMSNEYFDEYSKNVLNEATMAMYGFEKAKVKNYFPIHVDSAFLKSSFDEIKKDFSLENSGFMKDRQKGASNPLYLEGFTTAVNQQIEKVARYAGLAPALREFEKLYGVSTGGVTYNDSVKKAIGNVFGQAGTDYIEKLVADLNGNSRQKLQPWERFFQKARGRFAQGVLAVNAGVALKQRVSYLAAASELDYKSLSKALLVPEKGSFIFQGKQRRQNADELIAKWLPQLWKRSEGFIDVAMGEVRNVNQLRNRVNSKLNFLLGWIQASDISTVRRLWYASEYYVRDHTDLTPESDEYYRAVAGKYRDVIEKTQPNYTTLQRPALLRTNSEFIKSLTMFMTQRLQNINIIYDSVLTANKYARDKKNGRNGVTEEDVHEARMRAYRAVSSQLGAAVGMAAINFLTGVVLFGRGKKWKDENDEVTANSVLLGMLDDFLSSLCSNVVGGGEVYGIISSIVKGEKWKDGFSIGGLDTIEDAITSFSDALVKVRNGKELTSSDWIKIGGNVSTMFGIPGANAYKLARGLKNNLEGTIRGMEVDGEVWELGATPERTDDQNGRRMLNAFLEGNDEKFENLEAEFGSESKAEKAFIDALYEANRNGEITDDQVGDALEYIGYDDFDIGKVGEKWEGKDLTEREEELYNEWNRGMSFDEVVKTLADEGHELSKWDQHVLLGEWTAKKETGAKGNFVWSEELDEALEGYMRDTSTGSNMKSVIKQYREWGCEDSKLDDRVGYLFRDKYKAAYRESKTKAASIRGRIIVMLMECGRTEKKANDLVKQWEKDAAKK